MNKDDLLRAAHRDASDTIDEFLHGTYSTYADGIQRQIVKQTDGTWRVYRRDEDGARVQESELIIEITVADSADTDQSWLELYNTIAARVRTLYSENMRNDICEPIAFQNIMESIADGFTDYDNHRALDTTHPKG